MVGLISIADLESAELKSVISFRAPALPYIHVVVVWRLWESGVGGSRKRLLLIVDLEFLGSNRHIIVDSIEL